MLRLYIAKTLNNAHDYLNDLSDELQKKVLKHKNYNKQQQMITSELLLKHALKDVGAGDVKYNYTPGLSIIHRSLEGSKAHSDEYVLIGLSNDRIGVDIEKFRDVKNAAKILGEEELELYNKSDEKDKVFSMFWSAKESYIKYRHRLDRPYKEIVFKIEETINDFHAGKLLDFYCYHSYFNGYSFAVVTKSLAAPELIYVTDNELLGD